MDTYVKAVGMLKKNFFIGAQQAMTLDSAESHKVF